VKKWLPQALLVMLLAVLALLLRGRDRLPETPEKTVTEFFTAAGEGDDRAYLRLVTGELRESLEHARSQEGAEAFRQGLRRSTAGLKGHATSRLGDARPFGGGSEISHRWDGPVALEVTLIFPDRHEIQTMRFEPTGGGWAIAAIEQARMVKPPIPYCTPVSGEPVAKKPEGQPKPSTPSNTRF
jgi:hypothetical protein